MAKESDKPKKTEKEEKEVLDLIETPKKKPSRRQRQREEAEKNKTVADAKKEALNIFDEEAKPAVKKTKRSGKKVLPTISKLLEDEEDPEFVKESDQSTPEVTEESSDESSESSTDDSKIISLKPPIIVSELADKMGLKSFQLMADLIALEVFVAPTQAIEPDIAAQICEKHGYEFEREKREKGGGVHKTEEVIEEPEPEEDTPEEVLALRAPIITIMGHVDHGKTSILDYIRKSRVAAREAGGITQHIGAYEVEFEGKPITFLDTPGHAIVSKMRSRGADVTDIIVIVIAADDGIMPQTKEAIEHAQRTGKTIIIAINKCDVAGADPTRVMTQLMEYSINPTDFGGDVDCVQVSAITGDGMDELLSLLALQAEVLELKANPEANARASIIEAKIQAGKGSTASVIVQAGTLKVGMPFICGPFAGKVKSIFDDSGKAIKSAGPAKPVEIGGFAELPNVGDELVQMENERAAKKLSDERQAELRQERLTGPKKSRMEDLMAFVDEGGPKTELRIILKTDVQGSVQAITGAIDDIESSKVDTKFISAAAGSITESDILMASSSDAIVIGFNTKVESKAVKEAKKHGVQIKLYSVVYELIDQVRDAMLGLLEPETREKITGHAEVKQVFRVQKGKAAGSLVIDGKVSRTDHARVIREGTPVFDGKMSTLRRFQDEVKEVKQGIECGIRLGQFSDYEEGDIIETYLLEKIEQTL